MMMNFNQLVYSAVAAVVMTYVAHHTGTADIGIALLAFIAHALHVPVTNGVNGNGHHE